MSNGRSRLVFIAMLVVVATVASSCYSLGAALHEADSPDTRPWWCHSTGTGGHHVDPAYEGQTKGMLSWAECKRLSAQFDLAIIYARQWPTLGDAEAAGFDRVVNYVEGMGTHHALMGSWNPTVDFDPHNPSFPGTALDEHFEPGRPEFLMYAGNSPSSPLTGFAWYVKSDASTPPEGFPGGNDWWHRHERLCFAPGNWRVVGENWTDAACAGIQGVNVHLQDWWMTHAWILEGWTTKADVFTNHHPCLLASGPAGEHDPCWAEAEGGGGHSGH